MADITYLNISKTNDKLYHRSKRLRKKQAGKTTATNLDIHNTSKLLKTEDKEKLSEATKGQRHITYTGTNLRVTADCS